mgnify:CR=1 FL=1
MTDDADGPDTGLGARRKALRQRPDYPRLVLIVALSGAAAGSYPVTVLSASLPTIAESLGAGDNTITWVIAAPLLAFALATPIAGKMGDLHGHRRIYLSGFMAGCVLSYATALAWDVASLIVLRTLAQTAIAVSGPSAMAMILSIYPKRDRPRALGIWAAVVALSPAVGVVTGGPLIEWMGWRTLFVVHGAAVLGAMVPEGAIVVDESVTTGREFFPTTAGAPPHDWINNRGGSIGYSMPVSVGAAVACPDRKVIALVGDGSAMYTVQSLWTMAREGLDITIVIFSNRSYNILRGELTNVGVQNPGPRAVDMLSLDRPDLDWVSMAKSMGVEATRSRTAEDLAKALDAGLHNEGPYLIEVAI